MRKQPAAVQPFLMLQAERERRGLIKCLFGYRQRNLEKIIVNCALRSDLKGKWAIGIMVEIYSAVRDAIDSLYLLSSKIKRFSTFL